MSEPVQAPQQPAPIVKKPRSTARKLVYGVVGLVVLLAVIGSLAGKPVPAGSTGGNGNAGNGNAGNGNAGNGNGGGGGNGPVTLLSLSGSGIKNSQTFTTTGPWTIAYSYDCTSFGSQGNFAVYVSNSSGAPVAVPVNELGAKGTSSSQVYDTGDLHLEINSECSWTVTATQP